uniref:Beta-defensin-like domain-containing protein n=1 Tax=Oryctolagus cuniculus TaxID=9986 RepID=A0A5F9CQN1_RABIT
LKCLNFLLHIPFLPGFSTKVQFPLSCLGNRGFCFPFRCLPSWEEIGLCFLSTQKCCRRWKKNDESPLLGQKWRKKQFP